MPLATHALSTYRPMYPLSAPEPLHRQRRDGVHHLKGAAVGLRGATCRCFSVSCPKRP